MASVRTLRPESLINLVRNGGLDFQREFWSFAGHTPELVNGTQTSPDGASTYLRYELDSSDTATVTQSFRSSATFDFPSSAVPFTRRGLQGGYRSEFGCLLGRSRRFSLGLSIAVVSGSIKITAEFLDVQGTVISEAVLDSARTAAFTGRAWGRVSGVLTAAVSPSSVRISITRTKAELCDVRIAKIQLSKGAYTTAPYTGDIQHSAIPENSVIMVLGSSCPAGFEPLASSTASSELWQDRGIETRKGAFPTGSSSSEAEIGDPTHNKDEGYTFTLAQDDIRQFESFDSTFGQKTSGNISHDPFVKSPADVPGDSETADHQHNVDEGGSIPVNRQFLFCQRISS